MKNEITVADIQEAILELKPIILAGVYGRGPYSKELQLSINGLDHLPSFRVVLKKNVVATTRDIELAVDIYNNITSPPERLW